MPYLLILVFIGYGGVLSAQKKSTKANLQEQSKRIEAQIRYNNKLLEETSKTKTTNLNQLAILNDQITQRDQLIKSINGEISVVNSDIRDYEKQILSLENEINRLKREYARFLVATWRHANSSEKVMFVMASENFNQAYRRTKYFQQYSAHRKKQVTRIRAKQVELEQTKVELEKEKQSKTSLLSKEQEEKKNLDSEKVKKNQVVSELQKKEKQLREEIKKNQAEAQKLSKQLEKIIAEEIENNRKAAAQKKAAEKSTTTPVTKPVVTPDSYSILTPEKKKLADNFVGNRGRLPWPVERGVITERFGTHDHPIYKGVQTKNDVINISSGSNEMVRAVFDGVVTAVFPAPTGDGKGLIILHGIYRTVYSDLKSVSVKPGQRVTTKQSIGVVDEKNLLKFQIRKDLQTLDPEQWIASR
jgi:septal ring factor EnvC (AmiA/AmiB activator)